jgi:DNA-binding transcriptional MerR regulator
MKHNSGLAVKDVARLTGVSVRTLHYYDAIGLLVAERSAKGYRLYFKFHLLRLQQILIGRSLGFSLQEIRHSLDDPGFDLAASLHRQRALLVERLTETHRAIGSIDAALERILQPSRENIMDLKSIFDGFDPAQFEEEAKARWAETEEYKESARRTARYSGAEWSEIKAEIAAILNDAAHAMATGVTADSAAALAIAERHRLNIDRWFYPLSPAMHAKLADMWETDSRFEANIDHHGKGLTRWIAAAVRSASVAR